jgi:uncharacterized phage protein gp47/JayE
MSASITVGAPPTTADVAAELLAYQTGQTGVVSDSNPGSQIRSLGEGIGNVCEVEGVAAQAVAFQSMTYGCWAAFQITPNPARQSVVPLTYYTIGGVATQNVVILAGSVVQTVGGTQFVTLDAAVLVEGNSSVTVPGQAVQAGAAGNAGANTITVIVSGIPYPLTVTNLSAATGGVNQEPISGTQARFASAVQEIGLSSPVAIANAAIGVQSPSSTETVLYATCVEPGVNPNLPLANQTAGWVLYIDNGSGTASSALINAVIAKLDGVYPTQSGYRDAGVPFQVTAVVPVFYSVSVTGTLSDVTQDSSLDGAVQTNVQAYEATLQFGQPALLAQLDAVVGNTLANAATSFSAQMLDVDNVSQTSIAAGPTQRVILTSVTVNLD